MSQQETHIGKLELFKRDEDEAELDYLKRVLSKFNKEFNEEEFEDFCFGDIYCYLSEVDLYDDVFYVNDKFYINIEHTETDDGDIQVMKGDDVNGYSYVMSFYNGGTCLSEMIEESLSKTD